MPQVIRKNKSNTEKECTKIIRMYFVNGTNGILSNQMEIDGIIECISYCLMSLHLIIVLLSMIVDVLKNIHVT